MALIAYMTDVMFGAGTVHDLPVALKRLRDLGVDRGILSQIASDATHDFSHLTNPRPASTADYLGMLTESF
jgi:alcohol dehydrogenase class IV